MSVLTKKLRNFSKQQLTKKSKPQKKKLVMKMTPKLSEDKNMTKKDIFVSKDIGKVDTEHFKKKKLNIDNLDVSSCPTPIRSSTPTPSESTIMAGSLESIQNESTTLLDLGVNEHQKTLLDNSEVEEKNEGDEKATVPETISELCHDGSEATEDLDIFVPFMPRDMKEKYLTKKALDELEEKHQQKSNESVCNEWMNTNAGISTNNGDRAPSLFNDSVQLSTCMLDVTSVSRNVVSTNPKRGMQLSKSLSKLPANFKFM